VDGLQATSYRLQGLAILIDIVFIFRESISIWLRQWG